MTLCYSVVKYYKRGAMFNFFRKKTVENQSESPDSWNILRGLFLSPTVAGAVVSPETAMRVSAVYGCVRLIAGAIAETPIHFYRKIDGQRQRFDHDYWWLFNERPCPTFSAASFWEWIVWQVLLRGDSICYLDRNRDGKVINVLPFPRSQVKITKKVSPDPRKPDRLTYYFQTKNGAFGADQDDVLHFSGFGFDGEKSMSVIEWGARSSTGIAISANDYAGSYFETGGQPHHVIKTQGKMTEAQQKALRDAWLAKYGGNKISGVPLILTEGLDVSELTMTAKDAQLLESRQWQVIDIARAFGVPPHMVGEMTGSTSWGSGIEQLFIGFNIFTTAPHMKRFQQELNFKLFQRAGTFCEFDTRGMMKSDHKSRAEYYKTALGGTQNPAWMTQDEVRKLENLPPVDKSELAAPKIKEDRENAEINESDIAE